MGICFLKAGELPGASGRDVLGSFEALPNAPGRPLGLEGASGELGGASGELWESFWELWGAHWEAPGTMLAALGLIFKVFGQHLPPTSAEEQA